MNIDQIYGMLDEIKEDGDASSLDNIRQTVSSSYNRTDSGLNFSSREVNTGKSYVVKKPVVPADIGDYDSRYDYFIAYLSAVDYGNNNSPDYMSGHMAALEKYYNDAQANKKDLTLVEARLNDEVNEASSVPRTTIYEKGYYDGLYYVIRSLKKSKEHMTEYIYKLLKRELG